MQFSWVVYKPHRDRKTENMVRLAQHAHRLRFDSIWVTDPIVLPTKMTSRDPYSQTGEFPPLSRISSP